MSKMKQGDVKRLGTKPGNLRRLMGEVGLRLRRSCQGSRFASGPGGSQLQHDLHEKQDLWEWCNYKSMSGQGIKK